MIPSALQHVQEIAGRSGRVAVFLDYDGTLTPIVSQPEDARLSDSMRQALRDLAARAPVAILSGRDLDDVRNRVEIDNIVYGGSHGFDIAGPRGLRRQVATEFLPNLDIAEKELREALDGFPGARVERKRFSIAAHYRNVKENEASKVEQAVNEIAARHRELRKITGKKVCELQPDIDWNKGKALLWMMEYMGSKAREILPVYIGDDATDEDAFRVLQQHGVGILVTEQPSRTLARYMLKDPAKVELFLRDLAARIAALGDSYLF
jgi:trehalose 6-phosphate phosphatase